MNLTNFPSFSDFIVIFGSTSHHYTAVSTMKSKADGGRVVESRGNHIWIAPDLKPAQMLMLMLVLMLCRAGIGGSCFELVKGGLPAPAASEPTPIHSLQWPHVYTIALCITIWLNICGSWLCGIILDIWSSTSWSRKPRSSLVKTVVLGIIHCPHQRS